VLYGFLFVVALPTALILWAHLACNNVSAPAFHHPAAGAAIAAVGIAIALTGMLALWRRGGGLPMNAWPPPRFVTAGIYALFPHPIYGGFVLACIGVSIATASAAGLWLVTPVVALACSALVLGYEMPDLRIRFGIPISSPWLPSDHPTPPTLLERLRVYLVIIVPWFVLFEGVGYLGDPPDAFATYLPIERSWPVLPLAEPLYFSTYIAVLLFPLFVSSARALRSYCSYAYRAMALVFPLYLLLPLYAPPRQFFPHTFLGGWLQWERSPIAAAAAFPSFHIVWTCIVAIAFRQSSGWKKYGAWTWALLVAASCIATGMHSVADVVAGFAAFAVIVETPALWTMILRASEHIANSWREWRFGPVRIINHGAYAGFGVAIGAVIINAHLQPGYEFVSFAVCVGGLIGAALWAQWIEGSPALLRPLGFYGGVIGGSIGAASGLALHLPFWTALGAVAVAAPWIQGIGRLRCLVQGCCHGRPAQTVPGIRYTHPRSRVTRIAHLNGIPIHATPVYSLLWCTFTGAILFRLATLHVSSAFLCAIFLVLSGCGRFVEEAYRGEPQTRILFGLRFYQWMAILSVLFGAVLTCVRGTTPLSLHPVTAASIVTALACGLLTWFVSGVDFPESNRRFARLT
jgi:protein-S-isoprenylcysteine O-methyltransferase Ste14